MARRSKTKDIVDVDVDQPERPYEVGNCKPPIEHRFKPGNNANPKGRPRKVIKSVTDILAETVELVVGGKLQKMTFEEVIYRRAAQDAMKGNLKSAEFLFTRRERLKAVAEDQTVSASEEELKILDLYLKDIMSGDKPGLDEAFAQINPEKK